MMDTVTSFHSLEDNGTASCQKIESCQRHESFDMTLLSGEIMDKPVPQHDLKKTAQAIHTESRDSVYDSALCLGPIWNDIQQDLDTVYRAPSRQSSPLTSLKWLCSVLAQSPTLSALMQDIDIEEWAFSVSRGATNSYKIDVEEDVVILPSLMKKIQSRHNLVLNTIRALRDIWYEDNHFDLYESLNPEEWLKWEKIRSADIESFTVLVSWELRIAGERDLWRTLMASEIGDMAMIFQAIDESQAGLESHITPLLHAFRQWYMVSSRVNDTDSATLAAIDETITHNTLAEPFGHERLEATDVQDRICLPSGDQYLLDVENMLSNPDFCAIPDEINQTHFFHIMTDLETVQVSGVRFRDKALAALIFPQN